MLSCTQCYSTQLASLVATVMEASKSKGTTDPTAAIALSPPILRAWLKLTPYTNTHAHTHTHTQQQQEPQQNQNQPFPSPVLPLPRASHTMAYQTSTLPTWYAKESDRMQAKHNPGQATKMHKKLVGSIEFANKMQQQTMGGFCGKSYSDTAVEEKVYVDAERLPESLELRVILALLDVVVDELAVLRLRVVPFCPEAVPRTQVGPRRAARLLDEARTRRAFAGARAAQDKHDIRLRRAPPRRRLGRRRVREQLAKAHDLIFALLGGEVTDVHRLRALRRQKLLR